MPEPWQGKMLALYEVTCARCEVFDQVSPPTPARKLRKLGWRMKRGEGWLCPAHVAQQAKLENRAKLEEEG